VFSEFNGAFRLAGVLRILTRTDEAKRAASAAATRACFIGNTAMLLMFTQRTGGITRP
ncbi:hypothetical protein Dimus_007682, partial [Dionaea muscipula]